jgi:hypothetical protein
MTCVSASFAVGARCQIRLRPLTLPKRKRKPTRHTLAAGIPPRRLRPVQSGAATNVRAAHRRSPSHRVGVETSTTHNPAFTDC